MAGWLHSYIAILRWNSGGSINKYRWGIYWATATMKKIDRMVAFIDYRLCIEKI
jgi:hypothetical protein